MGLLSHPSPLPLSRVVCHYGVLWLFGWMVLSDLSTDMVGTRGCDVTESIISPADFAIAAWHEDGRWQVAALPLAIANDLDSLVNALRSQPTNGGATGLLSVSEDFFVIVRVLGHDVRFVLSDVTAATDWAIARQVLAHLGLPMPDEDEEQQPAGDLGIFADLGLEPMELGAICDDLELYPDEQLQAIAHRLGFGDEFSDTIDSVAD